MNAPTPTKQDTADALYEAGIIVDILQKMGTAADQDGNGGVHFTSVQFLTELLDERLELIGDAARAAGAA
jgi:hypothetical protein